jgi:aminopeptidase-like protein
MGTIDRSAEIDRYLKRLFPIHRSITGEGVRETLRILGEIVPLEMKEYPSGEQVYDWTIPKEWVIRDAWIKNSRGEKVVDYGKSNLHVMSYSVPVRATLSLNELAGHLYFLENMPDAIPYRTSYYREDWGFCLSYDDYRRYFRDGETYEAHIDSDLHDGCLTVGEVLIPGRKSREYLISTYICHPSLANDNLSGTILTAFLARELMGMQLNFSYRIIFVPETIGAIAYCARNEDAMRKIEAGFVATTVAGPGKYGYKQSFDPGHPINSAVEHAFRESGIDFVTYPFDIHGSDERQYSSQSFRINVVTLCRDKYYEYACYHTSKDDLAFVSPERVDESLRLYLRAISLLDGSPVYRSLYPNCEVMLSKRGLYPHTGGAFLPEAEGYGESDLILWLLFYCDGVRPIYDIAHKLKVPVELLLRVAERLRKEGLVEWVD